MGERHRNATKELDGLDRKRGRSSMRVPLGKTLQSHPMFPDKKSRMFPDSFLTANHFHLDDCMERSE
jgi:hypothetical protein